MCTVLSLLLDPFALTACAACAARTAWRALSSPCTVSRLQRWRPGGSAALALYTLLAARLASL